jgi:hypothetical protein
MLDEDDLELRARIQGIPVRLQYELDMGWVSLEMKVPGTIDELSLEWDPEKIPVHADGGDDDWDEEDEYRVFVGKGVFVEGDKDEVNQTLGALASLPAEASSDLVSTIEKRQLSRFSIYTERMSAGFKDNSYEMRDPIAEITEVTGMMARVAQSLGSVTRAPEAAGAAVAESFVRCSYCGTKFVLGPSSACPNCGASYGT